MKTVLVTGGTGLVGKNLQKIKPNWIYLSSQNCNLLEQSSIKQILHYYNPDAVIHLAARVGGIKDNSENQAEYFYQNVVMNTNLIDECYKFGIKRVLSSLSTCTFPDIVKKYPFTEKDFFDGPPAETNFSYGFSKRMLHVQSISYRKQYNVNYSTFCPSNLYGPYDHFNSEKSHFVASLITKLYKAKDNDILEFWGTGKPLRQQLFVEDLCKLIPILLKNHNTNLPLIIAPTENLSINDMINIAKKVTNKKVKIEFNNKLDGQYRKDGSNKELSKIVPNFQFTDFKTGFKKTYKWYSENNF